VGPVFPRGPIDAGPTGPTGPTEPKVFKLQHL
jgi:hypothetical protein